MLQTAIRVGNSVGIVIPKALRRQLGINPGDQIVVEPDASGHAAVLRKNGKLAKSSSVTPEFLSWLETFDKQYGRALKELATR